MRIAMCAVVLLVGGLAWAADPPNMFSDDDPPAAGAPVAPVVRSPAALAAIKRSDAACNAADVEARTKRVAAKRQLAADLRAMMKEVLASGNLDEANAVRAEIDRADRDAKAGGLDGPREARGGLLERLKGTRWKWPDGSMGDKAWLEFHADGTVRAGWHATVGFWAVMGDDRVTARIAKKEKLHQFVFARNLRSAQVLGEDRDGVQITRIQ